MGIYFNDKLLEPNKNGNEIEKKYFEGMESVNSMFEKKDTVVLVRDVERQSDATGDSFRAVVPFALPTAVPLYLDSMGAVEIRYSKAPPQKQGKSLVYPTFRLFMYERMILTKQNKDLAWFMLKATNFIGDGDIGSKNVIRIYNPEKNVLDKASEVKRIAKVDALLMNDDSPVYNIASMRTIADNFGVDIKDYNLEAAGFTIREEVINADNSKNPDFNIKKLLAFADTLTKKNKKVVEEPKEKEHRYSRDELAVMYPAEINPISDKFGTEKPTKVKKEEQINQILEAQNALVES